MKTWIIELLAVLLCTSASAQHTLSGTTNDSDGNPVSFANVALYRSADSSLVKVELTDDAGGFTLSNLIGGTYALVVTYLGAADLRLDDFHLEADLDLGILELAPAGIDLQGATVTATRALVEVKTDRTVFNVQGTINATGNNGLELLRMTPGVDVDNNENILVLSRSGVLVYVDGRRLPLSGVDLSNYLRNLTAEQIDRIEVITSPGARYEAEGNAGILDIRLKKAEDEGANGSVAATGSQGRYARYTLNGNGNYRSRSLNAFANVSYNAYETFTRTLGDSRQNEFRLIDYLYSKPQSYTPAFRAGVDYFLSKKSTLGILYTGQYEDNRRDVVNSTEIYQLGTFGGRPDSILLGGVDGRGQHNQSTLNLNYSLAIGKGQALNVDLNQGRFRNDDVLDQPNRFVTPDGQLLSVQDNYFDTPRDIDIYTAKLDYDFPLGKGAASAGAKFSSVRTENTFLFYAGLSENPTLIPSNSNRFTYDEKVYAGYISYGASLSEKVSYSGGLRVEATDALGELTALDPSQAEPDVSFNYVSFFPNAALSYAVAEGHTLNFSYGRRINRPDYNVLNPFRVQLNKLSYERGNPRLRPEIVNNFEVGYTLAGRYNFKLGYSRTADQITTLYSPDTIDTRAAFMTYANLAEQQIFSLNASGPVQITDWWRLYMNASASYINNQADYGEEGMVDLQVFNYRLITQQTFTLPWKLTGEITGYYFGPGVAGATLVYQDFGMLGVGLQRGFLNNQLSVKLSGSDLLLTNLFNGTSDFNGLVTTLDVLRDSRRVALSLSYDFGNQKVRSRRRQTGLDEEAGRVK